MVVPRRSPFHRSAPVLAALALAGALAHPAAAQESAVTKTKSDFPDRRWTPVGAVDGGLSGAGLATDAASAAYANPALLLDAGWSFRIAGLLLSPNRDDLRATTVDYDEAAGFPAVGEIALRGRAKGLGWGAYFAQPHYEHAETRFIGYNPALGGGGDPYPRVNTYTSATRLAGLGLAMRLKGGAVVGVAAEGVFTKESYESVPDVPAGTFVADTLAVDRSGSGFGGVVGVSVPFGGTWSVGGSYRFSGPVDDGDATDDGPALGLLGVRYGRTAGSVGHAGVRWLGERTVDLADPQGPAAGTADTRLEYALGYAYLDPAGTWTVRVGGALSPAPNDAATKLTRFGFALGLGGDGLRGSLGYARESESRADDRNSSRNLLLATVELGR